MQNSHFLALVFLEESKAKVFLSIFLKQAAWLHVRRTVTMAMNLSFDNLNSFIVLEINLQRNDSIQNAGRT